MEDDRKMVVLVVDDEDDFRLFFARRFSRRGMKVLEASGGVMALETLRENPVDVVLLDLKMPGMDGMETLIEVKRQFPTVEVILLTGHGSTDSGVQSLKYGAYDYTMKPYDIDELEKKIRSAFERRSLHLERLRGEACNGS